MSEIITYKKSPQAKYCQIKLDDGNRILISLAQTGVRIYKLKWKGLIPGEILFNISTEDLFSEKNRTAREKLTEISLEEDMLDVFKDLLLSKGTLKEAKDELNRVFPEPSLLT